ncbi:MAG: nicotinate phosphoribosyltransferase [Candidatus Heimdallarchaeota archaeon]
MSRRFRIATEQEILAGETTDIYFDRTLQILDSDPTIRETEVVAEVTVSSLRHDWAVLAGMNDAINLLEGKNIDLWGLKEGSVFASRDISGVRIPIFTIVGRYEDFAHFETPLLGFLGTATGMATNAARTKLVAKGKTVLSFGARRAHPALSPLVSYCAYIGGCDGVSSILGAKLLGLNPSGTMPHALVILFQSHEKAWKAFDRVIDPKIPRIALCDTYLDEKAESLLAVEVLGDKLWGVRLDTPGSRRGDFLKIIQEIRWEFDVRNHKNVKIFVSGGLGEKEVAKLRDYVDGFGVGSAISSATPVDFALDIVAIKKGERWVPAAKRGKFSGHKTVWQCERCFLTIVTPFDATDQQNCTKCGTKMACTTTKILEKGKRLATFPDPDTTRERILEQLKRLSRTGIE